MREEGEQFQGMSGMAVVRGGQYAQRPQTPERVNRCERRAEPRGRGPAMLTPLQRWADREFHGVVVGWVGPDGAVKSRKLYAVREHEQFPMRSVARTVEAAAEIQANEARVRVSMHEFMERLLDEAFSKDRPTPPTAPAARVKAA